MDTKFRNGVTGLEVLYGLVTIAVAVLGLVHPTVIDEPWNPASWIDYAQEKKAERLECLDDLNATKLERDECQRELILQLQCLPGENLSTCKERNNVP